MVFGVVGAKMDYFWAGDKFRKIFRNLLIHTSNFCFLNIALFLLYLQFTFFPRMDGQKRVLIEAPPELEKRPAYSYYGNDLYVYIY